MKRKNLYLNGCIKKKGVEFEECQSIRIRPSKNVLNLIIKVQRKTLYLHCFSNDERGIIGMKVKFLGESNPLTLMNGKIYDVISVEKKWYRIIDETGEDYLYPPECFEIVEK